MARKGLGGIFRGIGKPWLSSPRPTGGRNGIGLAPGRAAGSAGGRKSGVMRRIFLIMVIAGLVTGATAGPALASSQTHHRFSSAAVVAVWHSKARLSAGRFRLITWFVGVFPSGSRTSSQVFKDVAKCKIVSGHPRCRQVSFSSGFRRSLTAAEFTFDRKHLEAAHLDAAYKLRTFIRGKPVRTSRVTIVADWAGTGKIARSGGVNSFHSGCLHFHNTFKDRHRAATATGTVNRTSLGSTKDAFLSTSTDVVVEHRC
jgi:hypothetical protein